MQAPHHHPRGRVGVVLNQNAGRMSRALAEQVGRIVGREHVFETESAEHADEVLRLCVEREYDAVFAGGGDGTAVDTINRLQRLRPEAGRMPAVGILRLGTGNALARWLGAGTPAADLARYIGEAAHPSVDVSMVVADGDLFPFGGLGYDAAVLNDYYRVKQATRGTWLESLGSGLTGYFAAGLGLTVPNYLLRDNPTVRIVNIGREAWRIGPGGDERGAPIEIGEVLYEGPACVVGAATTPVIGYGARFFPFATRRAGRMQLRIMDLSPLECLRHFAAAWKGTLQHPRVQDFYVDRVRMSFSRAMPLQLAGDPRGHRSELSLGVSDSPVRLLGSPTSA